MRGRKLIRALVALMMVAVLMCGSAMAASLGAKAISSTAVYKSKGGSRVATLSQGTSFSVTGVSGSWARISYRGKTGYVKLKDVAFNKHIKAVTTKSASIKFMTKSSYRKNTYYTGTLAKGVTIYVAGVSGNQLLFFNKSGNTIGYISKSAVRRS